MAVEPHVHMLLLARKTDLSWLWLLGSRNSPTLAPRPMRAELACFGVGLYMGCHDPRHPDLFMNKALRDSKTSAYTSKLVYHVSPQFK